jgi:hypothetical protein
MNCLGTGEPSSDSGKAGALINLDASILGTLKMLRGIIFVSTDARRHRLISILTCGCCPATTKAPIDGFLDLTMNLAPRCCCPWKQRFGRDRTEPLAIGLTIPKGCTVFCMHPRKCLVAFSKR